MSTLPFSEKQLAEALQEVGIKSMSGASIRETVAVIRYLEDLTGAKFIRMDMGIPGLRTPQIGTDAEIQALKEGKSSIYGQIDGIPELKHEVARFVKSFIDIETQDKNCIITAGSMMGSMVTFLVAARREESRRGVLFIDPGFPVQKKQAQVIGLPIFSFDIYNYRGENLEAKLEEICAKNSISLIIYSNPNNPTWICLTDEELKAIANVANRHDIIVAEDLAYFGMDFRQDYSKPGVAPFQPSVAKYTDNYLLLISSSKVFSFAGQRVGALVVSDKLYHKEYPDLLKIGDNKKLGSALVMDGVYVVSAGTSHSAQFGLAAMLKAASDGEFNFLEPVKEYAYRAHEMKKMFVDKGFKILYDRDGDVDLADGFYFTVTYPGINDEELSSKLIRCGLGTVSLSIMGSKADPGVRISVSMVDSEMFGILEERLSIFSAL